ncbi:MAG: hypothetical protein ABIQ27_06290 [Flavobacterium sp.]|uniref:hypothetical protein n=1 Tax=Flavobacterium sp. TaxID=239 RepID=UPI003264E74E
MKKIQTSKLLLMWAVVILGISAIAFSCSSDSSAYTCASCHDTPEALAANDGSAKGIYKGVEAGSTGTLSINILNGSSTITATMVLDGVTALLTSSVAFVDGQAYVAPFTGTYNGTAVSITFSVAIGGLSPIVTASNIPGHAGATFVLYKETSVSLIEAFEGTYTKTGGETGVFNILLSRALNKWGGVALNNEAGSTSDEIDGTINADNQLIVNGNGIILGTVSGDEIHGSFQDSSLATISITGHRTL